MTITKQELEKYFRSALVQNYTMSGRTEYRFYFRNIPEGREFSQKIFGAEEANERDGFSKIRESWPNDYFYCVITEEKLKETMDTEAFKFVESDSYYVDRDKKLHYAPELTFNSELLFMLFLNQRLTKFTPEIMQQFIGAEKIEITEHGGFVRFQFDLDHSKAGRLLAKTFGSENVVVDHAQKNCVFMVTRSTLEKLLSDKVMKCFKPKSPILAPKNSPAGIIMFLDNPSNRSPRPCKSNPS